MLIEKLKASLLILLSDQPSLDTQKRQLHFVCLKMVFLRTMCFNQGNELFLQMIVM